MTRQGVEVPIWNNLGLDKLFGGAVPAGGPGSGPAGSKPSKASMTFNTGNAGSGAGNKSTAKAVDDAEADVVDSSNDDAASGTKQAADAANQNRPKPQLNMGKSPSKNPKPTPNKR
jgi:hypothetical protein